MEKKTYLKAKELAKLYPIKETSLRKYVRENTNNIHCATLKIGGHILFDLEAFDEWFNSQRLDKTGTP